MALVLSDNRGCRTLLDELPYALQSFARVLSQYVTKQAAVEKKKAARRRLLASRRRKRVYATSLVAAGSHPDNQEYSFWVRPQQLTECGASLVLLENKKQKMRVDDKQQAAKRFPPLLRVKVSAGNRRTAVQALPPGCLYSN